MVACYVIMQCSSTARGWSATSRATSRSGTRASPAYAGWTYVRYLNIAALGGEEWVIDGLIYQGPPPPSSE
jgi:hypothetical protein